MGRNRFVSPELCVLHLGEGDTLTVKRRLTAGEERAAHARMYVLHHGKRELDPFETGIALICAYLVDWSLTDASGSVATIRDQPYDVVRAAVDLLDPEDFREVRAAIETHDRDMAIERAEKKRIRSGAPTSPATSPSPVAAGGGTSG
jgi:hypothetical protein